jgi:hypothetical protein
MNLNPINCYNPIITRSKFYIRPNCSDAIYIRMHYKSGASRWVRNCQKRKKNLTRKRPIKLKYNKKDSIRQILHEKRNQVITSTSEPTWGLRREKWYSRSNYDVSAPPLARSDKFAIRKSIKTQFGLFDLIFWYKKLIWLKILICLVFIFLGSSLCFF